MSERDRVVRGFYEEHPYPRRDPSDEARRLICTPMDYLSRINHYAWSGRRDLRGQLRVLVAGGGTGDAAIFLAEQLRALGGAGTVVYNDVSGASLAVARARAEARGLTNISWEPGPLERLPRAARFDYINCAGVLHHLEHPGAGLAALAEQLAPDGVIGLGLYGYYGRTPVRWARRLLQRLAPPEATSEQRVALARRVLVTLPVSHPFKKLDRGGFFATLLADPAELQDLLLHPRERSYTVDQVYDVVESAGLDVIAFTRFFVEGGPPKAAYRPDTYLADPALAALAPSSQRERAALAELLHGDIPFHSLYVGRRRSCVAEWTDRSVVPFFFVTPEEPLGPALARFRGRVVLLEDDNQSRVSLAVLPGVPELLGLIDGRSTTGEVTDAFASMLSLDSAAERARISSTLFGQVAELLNRCDWLLLGGPEAPHRQHASARLRVLGEPGP